MTMPMLVVDKDIEVSMIQQAEWLKHGIPTVRVDAMQEAIEKLTREAFLFTAINANNIQYMPLLKVMCDTAPTFVFIVDSNYTKEKEVAALNNGADVYTEFNNDVELNVQLALAQLLRCNERNKPPKKPLGMMIYGNFLVVSESREIFCNDTKLKLTKLEYELLHYFITNHDLTLSYKQIYQTIWGNGYDEAGHGLLWNHIRTLRKKITQVLGNCEYIENEKSSGYRFSAPYRDK